MTKYEVVLNKSYLLTLWLIPLYLPIVVLLASSFGSIYVLSAWKELVMLGLLALLAVPIAKLLRNNGTSLRFLNLTIVAYVTISMLYVFKADNLFEYVAGLLFSTRFLLFFIVAQVMAVRIKLLPERITRAVVVIGALLSIIAILQTMVLPPRLLQHIGYEPIGVETPGFPPSVTTLGEVDDFIRPQATLRGPNPLGAFLVLPFCLLATRLLNKKTRDNKAIIAWLLVGIALLFTFSRSAWLAASIGTIGIVVYYFKARIRNIKPLWFVFAVSAFLLISVIALSNKTVRMIILREETHSTTRLSDDIRSSLTKEAWQDVTKNPLGRGPGNAGPVSVLDTSDRGRIAENYFLQVAQETGWLGLGLFVAIHALLLSLLWQIRHNRYALVAFTTLCGLVLANLTLHTWSDDAVSIIWWSFAGAIISTYMNRKTKHG